MHTFTRFLFLAALVLSGPALAADHYEFDKEHTRILFFISHVGFSQMIGDMRSYDGSFTFDAKKPQDSTIDVTISPGGIRTSSEKLDSELQNDKFFNTDKFPQIHFKSTKVKVTGKNTGDVTGDLTLLGVTKPVVLHVTFNKGDYHPITSNFMAGFHAEATLKRSDFGMSYGLPMVGDEVKMLIEVEGTDLDRKKAESIKH